MENNKTMKIILGVLFCIIAINSSALCADFPKWKVWVGDPKGWGASYYNLKKQTTITDNLEYNILELHYDMKWIKMEAAKEGRQFNLDFIIEPIGIWNNFKVFDIYDREYRTKHIILKAGKNDYRIIYSVYPADPSYILEALPLTKIKNVDGTALLITKMHVYRSEHYEHFIYYDLSSLTPIIKDLIEALNEKAISYVKRKYKVACDTDIEQLTFSCGLFDMKGDRLGDPYWRGDLSGRIGFEKGDIVLKNTNLNMTPQ
jgi:hypothetical protein